mmetsp:Transcript_13294/g.27822  ORF Transcript_13294/g.27822 Transcript_13294/m.27822 type:complete len:109 (-) Transcript_13294:20-346(-)
MSRIVTAKAIRPAATTAGQSRRIALPHRNAPTPPRAAAGLDPSFQVYSSSYTDTFSDTEDDDGFMASPPESTLWGMATAQQHRRTAYGTGTVGWLAIIQELLHGEETA